MEILASSVVIPATQRELKPQEVERIASKMKAYGYNVSYPITLESDGKTLNDGGHRLEAAKIAGIESLPYIVLPPEADPIAHAIRANADGADTTPHDVFDLAELCYTLSEAGESGAAIGSRLGWDRTKVVQHQAIKTGLCALAWGLARGVTADQKNVTQSAEPIVTLGVTIVTEWKESHFRSFLKHLPQDDTPEVETAQVEAIQELLSSDKKITAKKAGDAAQKYAWYVHLERYVKADLVPEVKEIERTKLLANIRAGAFGKKETTDNQDRIDRAVCALNEDVLKVVLYHDDALQRIPLLDDKSIALVATDPPYNVTDFEWDKIGSDDEFIAWTKEWLDAVRPKLATNYHLFVCCDLKYQARIEMLLLDDGWPLKSRIVWEYRNLVKGRDVKGKFICNWQMIFHCGTHPLNWPDKWDDRRFAVQRHAAPQTNFNEGKVHPTQKPESLFKLFVELGSAPGDIVLDMFAGGGTTGAACISVGQRQCILIEKEDKHCKAVEKRLKVSRA